MLSCFLVAHVAVADRRYAGSAPLRNHGTCQADRKLLSRCLWLSQILGAWLGLSLSTCGAGVSALDWQAGPGHRTAVLIVAGSGKPGFTLLSPEATGVKFTNQLSSVAAA